MRAADGQWEVPAEGEAPSWDGSPPGRPSLPLLEIKLPKRGSSSGREHTAVESSSTDAGDGDLVRNGCCQGQALAQECQFRRTAVHAGGDVCGGVAGRPRCGCTAGDAN